MISYNKVELVENLQDFFEDYYPQHSPMLEKAVRIAGIAHEGQVRRGVVEHEYIIHPLRVANNLINYGVMDHRIIVAGLLHDVIEDGGRNYLEHIGEKYVSEFDAREKISQCVQNNFGNEILRIVSVVSNPYHSNREREQLGADYLLDEYFSHIGDVVCGSPEALLVKISDYIDNAGGISGVGEDRAVKLAGKYFPVAGILLDGLDRNHEALGELIPEVNVHYLEDVLSDIRKVLSVIVH